jgi:lipid-A-disaccharide synthase
MYYVAPQVWAWAPWRIEKVRRLTDAVACLLPFEEPYLRDRGVNARFVGHPLLDRLDPPELPSIAAAFAIGQPQVALLPGSRKSEIANHAGAMAEMADRIRGLFPGARFAFAAASAESARQIQECAGRGDLPIEIGQADRVLSRSHFGLIASGTATLEAAYFGVPMVIVHRGSFLGYHVILRWMLCTRYLSLVNILANQNEFLQGHDAPDAKPLCPELMPWHGDMEQLWSAIKGLLKRPEKLTAMRRRLLDLIAPLKAPGGSAAENVAQMVIDVMRK